MNFHEVQRFDIHPDAPDNPQPDNPQIDIECIFGGNFGYSFACSLPERKNPDRSEPHHGKEKSVETRHIDQKTHCEIDEEACC